MTSTNLSLIPNSRLTKQSQGTNSISYMYNQKGNVQSIKDAKGQITSYEYDMLELFSH
jgi:YD repeat-containing protein